ncbi:hypothetical protein ACOSP7_013863 [Xanthoceras sorbifolium]
MDNLLMEAEILHFLSHMGELRKEFVFGDTSHNSSIVIGDMACVEGNGMASVGGNSVASDRRSLGRWNRYKLQLMKYEIKLKKLALQDLTSAAGQVLWQ